MIYSVLYISLKKGKKYSFFACNIYDLNVVKWEGADRQHNGHKCGSSVFNLKILILLT